MAKHFLKILPIFPVWGYHVRDNDVRGHPFTIKKPMKTHRCRVASSSPPSLSRALASRSSQAQFSSGKGQIVTEDDATKTEAGLWNSATHRIRMVLPKKLDEENNEQNSKNV